MTLILSSRRWDNEIAIIIEFLQIDQLNKDIMEITMQRDKKDESNEDQLSIYRHQASAVQRKKANLADQLQAVR